MATADLFTGIHKAVRNLMFTTGLKLQNLDSGDADECLSIMEDIHLIFDLFEEHARNEDRLIFPLVAAHEPELVAALEAEHHAHAPLIAELRDAMDQLDRAVTHDLRIVALARLRIAYFDFVGEHLRHMNREEREMLPATQRWASDEELAGTLGQIISGTSPETYATWLRWMLPALMPTELAGMLRGIVQAPAPLMAIVETVAADVLPTARWTQARNMAGLDQQKAFDQHAAA